MENLFKTASSLKLVLDVVFCLVPPGCIGEVTSRCSLQLLPSQNSMVTLTDGDMAWDVPSCVVAVTMKLVGGQKLRESSGIVCELSQTHCSCFSTLLVHDQLQLWQAETWAMMVSVNTPTLTVLSGRPCLKLNFSRKIEVDFWSMSTCIRLRLLTTQSWRLAQKSSTSMGQSTPSRHLPPCRHAASWTDLFDCNKLFAQGPATFCFSKRFLPLKFGQSQQPIIIAPTCQCRCAAAVPVRAMTPVSL